jgi:hypothetical protein
VGGLLLGRVHVVNLTRGLARLKAT